MKVRSLRKKIVLVTLVTIIGVSMILISSGQCKELKELRVGRMGTLMITLDPNIMSSWRVTESIKGAVFEGLLRYKPDTMKLEPCLAERWEVSEDGKELTFYLRKGVQFHKGFGELTAEDVKATIDRFFESKKWKLMDKVRWIPPLKRIEVVDRYTVRFHLEYADYTLISQTMPMFFGWITSKKALDEYGPEGIQTHAVGTGPYEVEEWIPMQKVVLKRFPNYWANKPWFDKVSFISFGSLHAAGLALKAGELDISPVRPEDIEMYRIDPNLNVKMFQMPGFCWIGFNVQMSPMDDIRVRKAIRYAVDVDEILQAIRGGVTEDPGKLRANSILSPSTISGFWKDAPVYKPDLEKARKLLAEAGYPEGFTVIMPAPLHYGGEPEVGVVVQRQLSKVGINVEIPVLELEAFRHEHHPGKGKYPIFVESWIMAPFPEQQLCWFTSQQVEDWNEMKWSNPRYDELLKKTVGEPDPRKRFEYYIEMQRLMDEDVIAIWIEHQLDVKAWRTDIDAKLTPLGYEVVPEMKRK